MDGRWLAKKGGELTHKGVSAVGTKVKVVNKVDNFYTSQKELLKDSYAAGRNGMNFEDYRSMAPEDKTAMNTARKKREKEDYQEAKTAFKTAFQVPANMIGGMAVMIDNPWAGSAKVIASITSGVAFGKIYKKQIKKYKRIKRSKLRAKRKNIRAKMSGIRAPRKEEIKLKETAEEILNKPNILTDDKTIEGGVETYIEMIQQAGKQVKSGEVTQSLIKEMKEKSDEIMKEGKTRKESETIFANEIEALNQKITIDKVKEIATQIGATHENINVPKNFDINMRNALASKILLDARNSSITISEKYGADLANQIHEAQRATMQEKGFNKLSSEEKADRLQEASKIAIKRYLTADSGNIERVLNSLNSQEVAKIATEVTTRESVRVMDGKTIVNAAKKIEQSDSSVRINERQLEKNIEKVLAESMADRFLNRRTNIPVTVESEERIIFSEAVKKVESEKGFKALKAKEQAERRYEAVRDAARQYIRNEENRDRVLDRMDVETSIKFTTMAINREGSIQRDYSFIQGRQDVSIRNAERASDTILSRESRKNNPTMRTLNAIGNETARLSKVTFARERFEGNVVEVLSNEIAYDYLGYESEIDLKVPDELKSEISRAVLQERGKREFKDYTRTKQEEVIRETIIKTTKVNLSRSRNLDQVVQTIDTRDLPTVVMRASNLGLGAELKGTNVGSKDEVLPEVIMKDAETVSERVITRENTDTKPTMEILSRIGNETAGVSKIEFSRDVFKEKVTEVISGGVADGYLGKEPKIEIPISDELRESIDKAVQEEREKREFASFSNEKQNEVIRETITKTAKSNIEEVVRNIDVKNIPRVVSMASSTKPRIERAKLPNEMMTETKKFEPILRQAINLRIRAVEFSEAKTRSTRDVVEEILNRNKEVQA